MKTPFRIVAKLLGHRTQALLVGDVVRMDRCRVIGSDNEIVTLEIHGAAIPGGTKKRGRSRYYDPDKPPRA